MEAEWKKLTSYKRRSSRYMSYHAATKSLITDKIVGAEGLAFIRENYPGLDALETVLKKEKPDNVQEYFLVEMARIEHRRWCYSMAMNGWSVPVKLEELSGEEHFPDTNEASQTHSCLCDWWILKKYQGDKMLYDLIPFIISMYGRS